MSKSTYQRVDSLKGPDTLNGAPVDMPIVGDLQSP